MPLIDGRSKRKKAVCTSAHNSRHDKPIIIFGAAALADLVHFYFTVDAKRKVAGFTVDREYYKKNSTMLGLPIVPFDKVEHIFSPNKYEMFIALGPIQKNRIRAGKVKAAQEKGYRLASYISSRAKVSPNAVFGEHVMILEDVRIGAFAHIGNDVFIYKNCRVGGHAKVRDHCYLAIGCVVKAGAVLREGCTLERQVRTLPHIAKGEHRQTRLKFARERSRTKLPSLPQRMEWLGMTHEYLNNVRSTRDDFKKYIAALKDSLTTMPLWLSALYYQTIWNTPRTRLLNRRPLVYQGIFVDMRDIKRRLADRIEAELGSNDPRKAKIRGVPKKTRNKRILFNLPYVAKNDTTIVNIAKKFSMIRKFWPDAEFYVLVSDDFYVSSLDIYNSWRDSWNRGESCLSTLPPHNIHSSHARNYIEKIFSDEGVSATLYFTDREKDYLHRMGAALRWVDGIHPTVSLSFSMESVLDTVLYRRYASIRFGLGELLPIFSTDADFYVTQYEVKDLIPILQDNHLAADAPAYRHVHYPVKVIKPRRPPTLKLFGLSKKYFYIASISRHFDVGVFKDVCADIKRFLDRHENARWLLVGINRHMKLPAALRHKRIQTIPDCSDGVGMAHVIDVLVPVTPGTGITALSAMDAGTPVLGMATRQSPYAAPGHGLPPDVAIFLGQNLAAKNTGELGQTLERLYGDRTFYKNFSAIMQKRVKQLIKERSNAARAQFECIEEGLRRGQERLKHR